MIKKQIFTLLALLLMSTGSVMAQGTEPTDSDGDGKLEITSKENLIYLSQNSNADWSANYEQTTDISFNSDETQVDWDGDGSGDWDTEDQKGFSPIGNSTTKFTGSYEGDGYNIDGLYIDRPSIDYIGLFGYPNGATIENLGVTGVNFTGNDYTGGLVGRNSSTITSKCYSTGTVSGNFCVGGLAGNNYSTSRISNSYSTANVTESTYYVGGLVGQNESNATIRNSYNKGAVSGESYVGGLVGRNHGLISKCYSTGAVSGSSVVGGLVGAGSGTVNDSFWDTETSG
ncbi:MAG: hypothetical protein K9J27_12450 [Bacteroidales bacterium]|nr:hypothetical protein [Bacteroidales bacterium]